MTDIKEWKQSLKTISTAKLDYFLVATRSLIKWRLLVNTFEGFSELPDIIALEIAKRETKGNKQ